MLISCLYDEVVKWKLTPTPTINQVLAKKKKLTVEDVFADVSSSGGGFSRYVFVYGQKLIGYESILYSRVAVMSLVNIHTLNDPAFKRISVKRACAMGAKTGWEPTPPLPSLLRFSLFIRVHAGGT